MASDVESFLRKLEEAFPEIKPGSLTPKTELSNLLDWSSLNIMVFLATIATEYRVKLSYQEIKPLKNLNELFDFIISKTP